MVPLLVIWLWLSLGILEIVLVWFCAAMWVYEFAAHDDEAVGLLLCGIASLLSVLVYGIASTFIPRAELRSPDKRKRMASQRGHMTLLMYGLGCGSPAELLRVSYTSGYRGERGTCATVLCFLSTSTMSVDVSIVFTVRCLHL